ncbi:MAG: 5-(carboxyamino)imidazole ribonucleotide synthase [Rhodothermales bacterium]|jgi:5-(carboxyamino)imidazole ribonucleotide synthase
MDHLINSSFRVGVLGGGQLGRMLALKASEWNLGIACLDSDPDAPARRACEVEQGDYTSYDDVVNFGSQFDLVTVETERANVDGLKELESRGIRVAPRSMALRVVQDKGLQRQRCVELGLPVPRFQTVAGPADLLAASGAWRFPYIVKTRTAGYDGKGVFRITGPEDVDGLPDLPLLIEEEVAIARELSIIGVRNRSGDTSIYAAAEVHVVPGAFLADYLMAPVNLPPALHDEAKDIVLRLMDGLDIEGLLAVELFLDTDGRPWVNECSPRPHNTGHHTIEAALTSQYENHLRGILDLPLGSCESTHCAAMLNLLGAPDAEGPVRYRGLEACLETPGVFVHLYGKTEVRPHRKMGHVTLLGDSPEDLRVLIFRLKPQLAAVS